MNKIKTGIIGTGKVADLHAEALKNIELSLFTAVCNPNFPAAQSFAEKYGVSAYKTEEEMIVQGGVEVVTLATPHPVHAKNTTAALHYGAHVIVDKPLASTLEDCDLMIQTAKETGRKLAMISQRRLYAPVKRVKEAIVDGKIGIPILITVNMFGWRDKKYYDSNAWRGTWQGEGGGVLVNQAPHQIDIMQWYMGEIDEVYGYWANFNHPYIEVEDTSLAAIRFKNGGLGSILVSNSQNPALYGRVDVFGSSGSSIGVQTDGGTMFVPGMTPISEPPWNHLWTIPGEEDLLDKWKQEDTDFFNNHDAMLYYHQKQIEDFLAAIMNDTEPMISGEEGRKTVEIFTAIYRSQRDNKPIKFPLSSE